MLKKYLAISALSLTIFSGMNAFPGMFAAIFAANRSVQDRKMQEAQDYARAQVYYYDQGLLAEQAFYLTKKARESLDKMLLEQKKLENAMLIAQQEENLTIIYPHQLADFVNNDLK